MIPRKKAYSRAKEELGSYLPNTETEYSKVLDNWWKNGGELEYNKIQNRYYISNDSLCSWNEEIRNTLVWLTYADYQKCFRFAVRAYYALTASDFNRQRQRSAGEVLTNQIQGKLGEIALSHLFSNSMNTDIKLDFNVSGVVESQDIVSISIRPGVYNQPALKVSIKSSKLKNYMLLIPEQELHLIDRRSDIYVLSLVGLPGDHLLRYHKRKDIYPKYLSHVTPDFQKIPCRVAGWIRRTDLLGIGCMSPEEIADTYQVRVSGRNFACPVGKLCKDFEQLRDLLVGDLS